MRKLRKWILLVMAFAGFNALAISAPSITSCTRASSTSVSLTWTSVSGASYYVVRRNYSSSVGASSSIATPSGTSYTDSTAGADTCYYWVEAWDNSGASARSGMATASSGSGGGGGGSFTISATKGTSTTGGTITWSAQSGATGYRVVRGTTSNMDNANILVETVTGTSYTDTTGTAGKTYYYWIVAKKSSGYVTSSYAAGYKASSSSGGGDDPGTGGGTTPSYDGNPYTVQFNANGGEGTMANESFVYGTAKALTISTFKRTGYIFIGWATSSTATTPTYDDGQSVKNLTTTSGGTVKLYAVWQANAYTIKFNKNGGSGTMADLAMKYDTAKALTANAFQRPNYNFLGWATSSGATSATYTNKQSVKNLVSTPDGSITLYAVWQVVREVTALTARQRYPWNGLVDIDVTFRAAGLSTVSFEVRDTKGNTNLNARTFYLGNPEKKVTTLEVQPGTHRFVWDAAADLGSVTIPSFAVTAKVQEKFFNVNVTGGTGSGSFVQGKSATLTAASKTGYTFTAWSGTDADKALLASATSASTTLTIPSRDVAYEATYTPNTYTVKFNANGGTGTMAYESFTYDTAKALTANAFTREYMPFMGWAETADGPVKYKDGQQVKNLAAAGTKNLYAVWPRYLVIDLSGGANAKSYPVTYFVAEPSGGFDVSEYKTTKLVLKLLSAGSYKIQNERTVTLTKPFFLGLFEVTRSQYALVKGGDAPTAYWAAYPEAHKSYNTIRGSSADGYSWPSSSLVDPTSFMGVLQARTKLPFDLPTEAQWEYACRAGTTTTYSYGNSANGNYMWCWANSDKKVHEVGTKKPNVWGLYDMHGGLMEWCLDWYSSTPASGTDHTGPSSGSERVLRGGSWRHEADECTSSFRDSAAPYQGYEYWGFRISMPLPQ